MLIPQVEGEWWPIAGRAELGHYNTDKRSTLAYGRLPMEPGSWLPVCEDATAAEEAGCCTGGRQMR